MKYHLFLFLLLLTFGACTTEQSSSNEEVKTEASSISDISENTTDGVAEKTTKKSPAKKATERLGKAPVRLHMQEKIEKMHEDLMTQMESAQLNPKDVVAYHKESELYMSLYGDTLAAEYVFNAADLYQGIGDYKNAIEMWYLIYKGYEKEHPKAPHAMFQCAFTYDGVLDRKDLAKTLYTKFLKTYPNHELAKDAASLLKNLDKSPEDLIKEFQKKNAQ